LSTLFVALMVPVIASAEPAASLFHLPYLWVLAAGVSGLLTWITVMVIGRSGHLKTLFRKLGLAIME